MKQGMEGSCGLQLRKFKEPCEFVLCLDTINFAFGGDCSFLSPGYATEIKYIHAIHT